MRGINDGEESGGDPTQSVAKISTAILWQVLDVLQFATPEVKAALEHYFSDEPVHSEFDICSKCDVAVDVVMEAVQRLLTGGTGEGA